MLQLSLSLSMWREFWLQQQFTGARQLVLLQELGQWLHQGYNLRVVCSLLGHSARELGLRPEAKVLQQLELHARSGHPLAESMRGWFRADLQLLVSVGEQAGCLARLLQHFAGFLSERQHILNRALRSIWYPFSLVVLSVLATWLLGHHVLPRFSDVSDRDSWPQSSQLLLNSGEFLAVYGPSLVGLLLAGSGGVMVLVKQSPRWCQRWLNRTSWLAVYRWYCGVVLLQQTGLLLLAGLSLRQSLLLQQRHAAPYLRQHLEQASAALTRGERELSRVLQTGLISTGVLFRLQLQGQQGQLGEALLAAGQELQKLAERKLEQQRQRFTGACFMLTLALVVLMVAGLGQLMAELAATWV